MSATDLATARERVRALSLWRGPVDPLPLEGGLSNRNFRVIDGSDGYVVRVVGGDVPEHGILRDREVATNRAAHAAGIAPELVHEEPGIIVVRLVAGRTLTSGDIRDPAMLERIAGLLRRTHRDVARHLRGPAPCFWVFHALRDYLGRLAENGQHGDTLDRLHRIVNTLEATVGPVRFTLTHNDLMPGNLIDDGTRLWLIDWEYAGFGAPLFDLANLAVNNDFDAESKARLLALYFRRPAGSGLIRRFAAMALAARLRETLWGRIQEIHGTLAFDYTSYADEHAVKFERDHAAFLKGCPL